MFLSKLSGVLEQDSIALDDECVSIAVLLLVLFLSAFCVSGNSLEWYT